jgi:hypothetical protein
VKTISLKKVSAIAVASLGFGLLSVVPAQAVLAGTLVTTYTATGADVTTASAATVTGVIGTPIQLTITHTIASAVAAEVGTAILPVLTGTAITAGSAVTVANSACLAATSTGVTSQTITACSNVITVSAASAVANSTLTFTPDLAGTYIFTSAIAGDVTTAGAITVTVASTGPVITSTGGTSNVPGVKATVSGVGNGASFITVRVQANALDTAYIVSTSGVGSLYGTAPIVSGIASGSTPVLNTTGTIAGGFAVPKGAVLPSVTQYVVSDAFTFNVTSAVSGTQVVTVTPVGSTTPPSTMTITWGVAPVVGTVGSSSTSLIDASVATPFAGAAADVAISAPLTANTRQATIKVTLKDTQSTPAIIAAKAVTATVTGPGLVGGSVGTNTDNAYTNGTVSGTIGRAITANTDTLGNVYFGVYGDGTSGVSTITITQGTTVVGTEKVTFYGAVASFKATVKKNVVASGSATTAALDVIALDANSVVVPSVGITVTSGTTATIGSFTETTSSAAEATALTAVVDVTGASATFGSVVLTIKDTATGLISTTATVKVGALEAAAVTAAFDKTSYTPGALVTLTLTAKDVNGADVGDSITATSLVITTNAAVQGTLPTSTGFVLGKQVITFYAPSVGIPLTASVKLASGAAWSTALDDTSITATAAITDANAAIATSIAALNAKIVALNALIAKIMKRLNIK